MKELSGRLLDVREETAGVKQEVWRHSILFACIYGVMGASGMVGQALNYLTIKELQLTSTETATFFAIASIVTYLGPLYGLLSDTIPLFGTRRRSYLVLWGFAGFVAWGALGLLHTPTYVLALGLFAAALMADYASPAVANAVMVDIGKPRGLTGVFQSVQWGSSNVTAVAGAWVSGILLERYGRGAPFLIYAFLPLLTVAATIWLLREERMVERTQAKSETWQAIRTAVSSPTQWLVALFLFAWFFSPGLGTPLNYYQVEVLKIDFELLGKFQAIFYTGGILAAVIYARLAKRVPMKRLLGWAVGLGTIGHLSYLGLRDPLTAYVSHAVDGTLSMFAMLAMLDLGARVTPARAEGSVFSFFRSAQLVGIFLGGILGGKLYEVIGLHPLILISAGFTAACGIFLIFLREPVPQKAAVEMGSRVEGSV